MSIVKFSKTQNLDGQDIFDVSSGSMVLSAGTTLREPLKFTSGSLLTTPEAGAVEYDGRSFFASPDATAGESVIDTSHFYALGADRTLIATVVGTTFYSIFGVGIPVPSGTAYHFDLFCGLRTGTTSHTVSFRFGGTATYGDCFFMTEFTNLALSTGVGAAGTPTAAVTLAFTANPNTTSSNSVISPASIIASKFFRVKGMLSVTTTGTINPEIAFSANPTGTNQATRLSYFRLNPVGASTNAILTGNWA